MLKLPPIMNTFEEAHAQWLEVLREAQRTVETDNEMQILAKEGQYIPGRALPPEVLGHFYAAYCKLINQMYDAYLNSVHLQRSPYILGIVNVFVKRMYELRKELVHLIVNDYICVDAALVGSIMTPFDIQIVVPYHFPLEARNESAEQALQKMWADAVRRKRPKKVKPKPVESQMVRQTTSMTLTQHRSKVQLDVDESLEATPEPSVHSIINEESIQALVIQRHERFRQWYVRDFKQKCTRRRTYFAKQVTDPPPELKDKAARLIQGVYREVMKIKRQQMLDLKRDILLDMVPEHRYGKLNFTEENNKMYERRRLTKLKITETYLKEVEKENARLLYFRRDGVIDDITEQIREWFIEWYYGYGFFPQYPYEIEGGTILLLTGEYPTIEEKVAADEKEAAQNKGKSPENKKQELARAKAEAKKKAEEEREKQKKETLEQVKLKFNPADDPGYKVKSSEVMDDIIQALADYRASWSIYDFVIPGTCGEAIYGYMKPLVTEDLMSQMHKECRKYVDEVMRLELKLLINAHKQLYRSIDKPFPKEIPRKKPKVRPLPKTFELDSQTRLKLEPIFDIDIITKPKTKLSDVFGDLNFGNYEYSIRDPDATFLPPAYGDIKNRIMLSCVLASGIQPGAPRNKAVMLLGPPRNGKSFLIDAVAGELNAVKIDISPEVFSAVVDAPGKLLPYAFVTARAFQPAVIYIRNIERVFMKKVPPEQAYLKATQIRSALQKSVKQIMEKEKIIFIATCSDPFVANAKPMTSLFDEIILVPRTDYGSLSTFFYDNLQQETSVPQNFPYNSLAQLLKGYGFGIVVEAYNEVMSPARIVSMNVNPLSPAEFIEAAINIGEPLTAEEYEAYENFYLDYSPLKPDKIQYEEINKRRAEYYKKMQQKAAKSEAATTR